MFASKILINRLESKKHKKRYQMKGSMYQINLLITQLTLRIGVCHSYGSWLMSFVW